MYAIQTLVGFTSLTAFFASRENSQSSARRGGYVSTDGNFRTRAFVGTANPSIRSERSKNSISLFHQLEGPFHVGPAQVAARCSPPAFQRAVIGEAAAKGRPRFCRSDVWSHTQWQRFRRTIRIRPNTRTSIETYSTITTTARTERRSSPNIVQPGPVTSHVAKSVLSLAKSSLP